MSVPSSSGDFPAPSPAKFYGGGLSRPYLYNDGKFTKEKMAPSVPVAGPFLSWAREAQLTMGSLRFDRRRAQGRIDGSIRRLREDEEEEEEEETADQKKRPKLETIDSEESDDVEGSEEEEEPEKALDSDESEYSSDSEEEEEGVHESEDSIDSEESEDGEEECGEKQEIKGKPPVGCRQSKRLRSMAATPKTNDSMVCGGNREH